MSKKKKEGTGKLVRVMSCTLKAPENITDELLNYVLAWSWGCQSETISIVYERGPFDVFPYQGESDFGVVDVPEDWIAWHDDVAKDLAILSDLGVRGDIVLNTVGSLNFEKWVVKENVILVYSTALGFGDEFERQYYTAEAKTRGGRRWLKSLG